MKFRTKIVLNQAHNQIDYNSKLVLIGSCFSENISEKLTYFKFNTYKNPFGILFNPIAIENLITKAINQTKFTEKDIFYLNERWHCFEAHSNLSNVDKNTLLANLNTAVKQTHKNLNETSHLIITLGTSWVYRFIETDLIVGNCHKIPQKKFLKEILSVKSIIASLENIITLVKNINPKINIIFTISPVRHLKDGFVENSKSKAHLLAAIHQLIEPRKNINYFPSYEIMMDDLRDYRFYKEDMVHPNKLAIQYIWEQFIVTWVHQESFPIMKEVETIQKGLAHKPFNPNSKQHQQFLKTLTEKKKTLQNRFSHFTF